MIFIQKIPLALNAQKSSANGVLNDNYTKNQCMYVCARINDESTLILDKYIHRHNKVERESLCPGWYSMYVGYVYIINEGRKIKKNW